MAQEAAELRQRVAVLPQPHQRRPDDNNLYVQMPLFRVAPDSPHAITRPTVDICRQWLRRGRLKIGERIHTGEFSAVVEPSRQQSLWREVSEMLVEQPQKRAPLLQVIRILLEGGLEIYQAFARKRRPGQHRLFGLRFFVKDPFEEAQSPRLMRVEGYTLDIRQPVRTDSPARVKTNNSTI